MYGFKFTHIRKRALHVQIDWSISIHVPARLSVGLANWTFMFLVDVTIGLKTAQKRCQNSNMLYL